MLPMVFPQVSWFVSGQEAISQSWFARDTSVATGVSSSTVTASVGSAVDVSGTKKDPQRSTIAKLPTWRHFVPSAPSWPSPEVRDRRMLRMAVSASRRNFTQGDDPPEERIERASAGVSTTSPQTRGNVNACGPPLRSGASSASLRCLQHPGELTGSEEMQGESPSPPPPPPLSSSSSSSSWNGSSFPPP